MGQWDGIASPIAAAPDNWSGVASPVVAAQGNDGGEGVAYGEGVANSVPAGQKITSAMGAGIAKAASPLTGDDRSFSDLYKQAQADTETTAKANPKSALAGTATGIVSALPLFSAAGKAVGAGASAVLGEKAVGALSSLGTASEDAGVLSKTGNLAIRSAKGAAGAYPVGALYGAANADGDQSAIEGALSGGKTAAEIGAAIPVAGAALGLGADVAGSARSALNKDTVSGQAASAAKSAQDTTAMGKVIKRFNADFTDPDQRQAALDKYLSTNDVGLAEAAGKNTKNLALGAAQYPQGEAAAQDYFSARTSGSPSRIMKTFADQVSSNNDYFGTLDSITEKGRVAAKPLYDTAFSSNKAVVSPEIDEVLKTPAGKAALSMARNKMLNDRSVMSGLSDQEVGEHAQEVMKIDQMNNSDMYGATKVAAPDAPTPKFNLRTLDYVKRGLDDQIGASVRAGEKDNVRILSGLKNNFISALDDADETGAYAQARAKSGDYLRNTQAMEDGRDFMKPSLAPEEIKANFEKLGDTEKEAYKAGMVRAIKDTIDKPTAEQPDLYKKTFGSPALQNKLKAVLNDSEFAVLSKNMQDEQGLYKFKNDTLGNSRTALKQISSQEFQTGGQEIYQDLINNGSPTKTAIKAATKWVGSMFDGLSDKTAGQVSKILYETNPAKKLEILNAIKNGPAVPPAEKQEAINAYYSVNNLFKNMSNKTAVISGATNNEGENNGQ